MTNQWRSIRYPACVSTRATQPRRCATQSRGAHGQTVWRNVGQGHAPRLFFCVFVALGNTDFWFRGEINGDASPVHRIGTSRLVKRRVGSFLSTEPCHSTASTPRRCGDPPNTWSARRRKGQRAQRRRRKHVSTCHVGNEVFQNKTNLFQQCACVCVCRGEELADAGHPFHVHYHQPAARRHLTTEPKWAVLPLQSARRCSYPSPSPRRQ